jgi:hypothetical protein
VFDRLAEQSRTSTWSSTTTTSITTSHPAGRSRGPGTPHRSGPPRAGHVGRLGVREASRARRGRAENAEVTTGHGGQDRDEWMAREKLRAASGMTKGSANRIQRRQMAAMLADRARGAADRSQPRTSVGGWWDAQPGGPPSDGTRAAGDREEHCQGPSCGRATQNVLRRRGWPAPSR